MMKTTGESVVGKTWHQRENKVCCTSCEGGEIQTERAREIEMQTERERGEKAWLTYVVQTKLTFKQ